MPLATGRFWRKPTTISGRYPCPAGEALVSLSYAWSLQCTRSCGCQCHLIATSRNRSQATSQWMPSAGDLLAPLSITRAGSVRNLNPNPNPPVALSPYPFASNHVTCASPCCRASTDPCRRYSNQTLVPVRVWNHHKDMNIPLLAFYAKVGATCRATSALWTNFSGFVRRSWFCDSQCLTLTLTLTPNPN